MTLTLQPDAFLLREQADWEMLGTRRSIERYREAAAVADPATLPAGRRLLRECISPLIAATKAAQIEAQGDIRKSTPTEAWAWPILSLSAEKLAVITVTTAIREGESDGSNNTSSVAHISSAIAAAVRDEVEYEEWRGKQMEANKAAKETGDRDHVNLLAVLKRRHPDVHRNVWARWRKKVQAVRQEKWPPATVHIFGGKMIRLLVDACPGHFQVVTRNISRGRTQNHVTLTERVREVLADVGQRAEVARPRLMPMIMPPIPWAYPET